MKEDIFKLNILNFFMHKETKRLKYVSDIYTAWVQ